MKKKNPTVHYLELDANWPSCGLRKWILSTHIVEHVTCKNCQRWIRADKEQVDALYVTRLQVERWSDEELQRNSNLPAVKREIESRKEKEKKDEDDG